MSRGNYIRITYFNSIMDLNSIRNLLNEFERHDLLGIPRYISFIECGMSILSIEKRTFFIHKLNEFYFYCLRKHLEISDKVSNISELSHDGEVVGIVVSVADSVDFTALKRKMRTDRIATEELRGKTQDDYILHSYNTLLSTLR